MSSDSNGDNWKIALKTVTLPYSFGLSMAANKLALLAALTTELELRLKDYELDEPAEQRGRALRKVAIRGTNRIGRKQASATS